MHYSQIMGAAFVGLSTTVYCTPLQSRAPAAASHEYFRCSDEQKDALKTASRDVGRIAKEAYDLSMSNDWQKNKG